MIESIETNLFASRLSAICDDMGQTLARAAFSPNIKDRFDFSCALFDAEGRLMAQAAHIPVHLGSMAFAMKDIVQQMHWQDGDVVVLNDPFLGGTHLPDVTMVAPIFIEGSLLGFAVNRAHHANIGSDTPGSMPLSSSLEEEGVVISPVKLKNGGELDLAVSERLAAIDGLEELDGDFLAQLASAEAGIVGLTNLVNGDLSQFESRLADLNAYGSRLVAASLAAIPNGQYLAEDVMDGDGFGATNVKIKLNLDICDGRVVADFSGTAAQVTGNINCPLSVAAAGVFYVFRCLLPAQAPACDGLFSAITVAAPKGCLLNATNPAAVAAGNVETSTRVVDVVLKALGQALPEVIPAASHGSMNNIAMGSRGAKHWDYYETLGGGMGASALNEGLAAVQTHMTNTLNTPVEVLESQYPIRVQAYQIRKNSGGAGRHAGGDGLVRSYEFLEPTSVSLLTERREQQPWGVNAQPGEAGSNVLNGEELSGKTQFDVAEGDVLRIETPGGGGWSPAS